MALTQLRYSVRSSLTQKDLQNEIHMTTDLKTTQRTRKTNRNQQGLSLLTLKEWLKNS